MNPLAQFLVAAAIILAVFAQPIACVALFVVALIVHASPALK